MTSKEFILWLKGFTEAVHEFNITPKQWDLLKEKLEQVEDEPKSIGAPFGVPNTTPNTHPFPMGQESHRTINPHLDIPSVNIPFISITPSVPGTTQSLVTTTPGGGSITYTYPQSGSWHYTNSTNEKIL